MHIQPIGTGGAFDPYETCYLVNDCVLIDCGSSAIKRTFADGRAKGITHVFLSHIHNDHIGGFETLYYYLKYVAQKPLTEVYCPGEFYKLSQRLACMQKPMGGTIDFKYNYLGQYSSNFVFIETEYGNIAVQPFKVQHSFLEAYGFAIVEQGTGKTAIISCDTDLPVNAGRDRFDLMFHDIGWEGLPAEADDHKVHPRESDLVEAFGTEAPIITIHTSDNTPYGVYPRAVRDKIYHV